MSNDEFFPKDSSINFIVRNISPQKKKLTIFGCPLEYGFTRDLLALPDISESDIRNSLIKGELFKRVKNGDITVVSSTIDLLQYDSSQKSFLQNAGVTTGLEVGGLNITPHSIPDSAINPSGTLGLYVNFPVWSSQATWHVNAITGNDSNDGLTDITALKTLYEWKRRITNDFPMPKIVTLHIDSDIPSNDQLNITRQLNGTNLQIIGKTTQIATGTFTSVQATNRATNTELQVTASAFTFTGHEGKIIRITSGPNSGAISTILKVMSAHTIRVCKFAVPNIGVETFYNDPAQTPIEPSGTETFELLDVITLNTTPQIDTSESDWTSAIAAFFIRFGGSNNFSVANTLGGGLLQAVGCIFECGYFEVSGTGYLRGTNCYINCVIECEGNSSRVKFSTSGFVSGSYVAAYNVGCTVRSDSDCIFQDGATIYITGGATGGINNVCVIDCNYDFFIIDSLCNGFVNGSIYGYGNTNNIIALGNSQSRVIYEDASKLTATSSQPVLNFTGITKAFNELPFIYTINGNSITLA